MVQLLRQVLSPEALDHEVLKYAFDQGMVVITCNRNDFIELSKDQEHRGIILIFRRKSRMAEKAALLRLLRAAGESGLADNLNFA